MNATALTTKSQHSLAFDGREIKTVTREGQLWMSGNEIGLALEYACPDSAIKKLYNRVSDEFTPTMTRIIKVMTSGGRQAVRFFSLRGAHLLAMFARTDKAKAFRVWVLDILDREVAELRAEAARGDRLDERSKQALQHMCLHMELLRGWWERYAPALRLLNHNMSAGLHDSFVEGVISSRILVKDLGLKSYGDYAAGYPWEGDYQDKSQHLVKMRGAK